jgi:uncharacterized paraquat-inducible protein A
VKKINEIMKAWIIAANPSDLEKNHAQKRYSICEECSYRKSKLSVEYCGKCGCPLSKKIFSPEMIDTCPIGKWNKIDEEFMTLKKSKKQYKII